MSLKNCIYPSRWKVSRVTPVPKNGSSKEVTSQRPIAVLCIFGKIFESFINRSITTQINHRLDDAQHGFRHGRSTTTNHIVFVDYVVAQMDSGKQVDTAYFDLTKAFDVVDNDILLSKLSCFGFSPHLLFFIGDYLQDRKQYVQLGKYASEHYYTRSGVSQGSTLGPTLFLMMINDLPKVITSAKCLMFADDMKLYLGVGSVSDCGDLQRDIDAVAEWAKVNNLIFNVSKCKLVTYSRAPEPINYPYRLEQTIIQKIDKIRDLGIVMDSGLKFDEHIKEICKKANKTLGFITRTAVQFKDLSIPFMLYKAYVRSLLEFGAIVWDPRAKKYILLLERVQRKFARYLYKRMYGYYPYLFPSLLVTGMVGLNTLELRRKVLLVVHYSILMRNGVDNPTVLCGLCYFVPQNYIRAGQRRRHQLLAAPTELRTWHAHNAPTPRAITAINCFLNEVQDADIHTDPVSRLKMYLELYFGYV